MDIKRVLGRRLPATAMLSLFLVGLGGSVQALAQATELKVGFYQGETHLFVKVARTIFPELEQRTQGRYKLGVYASQVLGKAAEQVDMTNRGLTFANLVCLCYYPGTYPLFNIDSLPIWSEGVKGVEGAYKGGLNKLIEEYFHSKGMTNIGFLGATAYSVRSLGMKKVEVRLPGDLKGKKIRTLGMEKLLAQMNGGAVMSMPMPEVYEALQRNMISGLIAQESNWIDWKLYEVLDSIAFLDLTTSPMSLIYSKSDMNKIPEADRKIVMEVLNKFNEALITGYRKDMDDGRTFLTTKWKGKAYYLTPAEKQAFKQSVEAQAIKEYLEKTGEMGQRAIDIVKKYNP